MTRVAARADHLRGPLVEVVEGDVRNAREVREAVRGCQVVVSAVHGFVGAGVSPATVDRDGNLNLVAAAGEFGADVVLVSVVGAAVDSPLELDRMKYVAEQALRASPVSWTIVRAAPFLDLWAELLEETAARSGRPLVFGRGNNPIPFVPVDVVAAAVLGAVADPTLRGRVLTVAGSESRTLNELAADVQRRAGRAGSPRHVPRPLLRLVSRASARLNPALSRQTRAALFMDSTPVTVPPVMC